jgi:hypothetical protein
LGLKAHTDTPTDQQDTGVGTNRLFNNSSRPAVQLSPEALQSCRYQAGQTLLLLGQHKDATAGAITKTEVTELRADTVCGIGATGEVYEVTVLAHGLLAAAGAESAPVESSLAGQQLCLKVCRRYSCVPRGLQRQLHSDADAYLLDMRNNLLKHHTIMQECSDTYSLTSHGFDYIEAKDVYCTWQVPALLMQNAEGASLADRLKAPSIKGARHGLGWKKTQEVMSWVVCGLMSIRWSCAQGTHSATTTCGESLTRAATAAPCRTCASTGQPTQN